MRPIFWKPSPAAFALCLAGLVLHAIGFVQAQKTVPNVNPTAAGVTAAKPTESQVQARDMLMQMTGWSTTSAVPPA